MVTGHAWIALAQCVDGWLVYNVYCTHCGWCTIYIPMYVVHQHCHLRLNIQPLPTITAHSVHYASFTTWTKLCFPCDDDNILATMFNNADTANMNTNTVSDIYKKTFARKPFGYKKNPFLITLTLSKICRSISHQL